MSTDRDGLSPQYAPSNPLRASVISRSFCGISRAIRACAACDAGIERRGRFSRDDRRARRWFPRQRVHGVDHLSGRVCDRSERLHPRGTGVPGIGFPIPGESTYAATVTASSPSRDHRPIGAPFGRYGAGVAGAFLIAPMIAPTSSGRMMLGISRVSISINTATVGESEHRTSVR